MDFLDRLIDFIEEHVYLDRHIRVGVLGSDKNSISIRPSPSQNTDRYGDGVAYEFNFQITMKGEMPHTLNKMYEITTLLDGLSHSDITSSNDSFKLIRCEVSTRPNWVEETDRGNHMYTALFNAELE